LPSNRAGSVVRCVECKSVIQLPDVSATELRSGKPIPIVATLVNETEGRTESPTIDDERGPQLDTETSDGVGVVEDSESLADNIQLTRDADIPVFPNLDSKFEAIASLEKEAAKKQRPVAKVKGNLAESFVDETRSASRDHDQGLASGSKTIPDDEDDEDNVDLPTIVEIEEVKIELLDDERHDFDDHRTLAKFYGFCIAILGLVSLVPAIIFLIKHNQAGVSEMTPRWIFFLIFVGALHVIYSIYLIQIADWSALWAVSILMLVASCIYGMLSAAILLDDGYGPVVHLLQLSFSNMRSASIWCLIGLCLSVLTSYLCGREALSWRRNEKLLIEIVGGED
jgi:hypothetical protein